MENTKSNITQGEISRSPSPNRGLSMPDVQAISSNRESIMDWQMRNGIDLSQQIRLVRLGHMRYQHPDLVQITTFLRDFGMHVVKQTKECIWYAGYGIDQYVYFAQKGPKKFLGGTYVVESFADLERAAKLPGAGKIHKIDEAPGGGSILELVDPEGFLVNLMYGQKEVKSPKYPKALLINSEIDKPRKKKFQRFEPGPAAVHKLGHYGLCVQKFDEQVNWYTRNFNLVPSDFLYVEEDSAPQTKRNVALFAHIDRGEDLVDHHTFFMSSNLNSHVHHCSFEVHDFDTQKLGHQWLAAKGYKSVWGVGRHVLGSQIFDYWWDTTGNMIEHYTDGDLINKDTPIGYGPVGDESLSVWGPDVPSWFLE